MGMSERERVELGAKIQSRRERLYGTKRAAYTAAEVNGATWDKAEAGESLRGDRLRSIVRTLWPETEGDWTRIDAEVPQHETDPLSDMAARIAALEERIAEVLREQVRAEQGDSSGRSRRA